ncbi:MAG: hypothetical protein EXQ70_00770 [Solirubrobacterales bacterium]|nr:hypothetical protein [Solirubrobacterales bacterium]
MTLALPLPLALAACGGSDEPSDSDQVTEVIQDSATSTDPADCSELLTQQFMEQTSFSKGKEALKSCEDNADDTQGDPDSVDVSEVKVEGDTALANAAFTGGNFDGSTLTVSLVKEGDQWQLDQIVDTPSFNAQAFQDSLVEQAEKDPSVQGEVGQCVIQQFQGASEQQIKALILSGDEQSLVALVAPCAPSG